MEEIKLYNIESIERIDSDSEEYVYDIEVEDNHNFFANDILVHNSIYVEFGRITNYLGINDVNKATRFIVDLWNYGCGQYMRQRYDDYADSFNCDENLEELELEKIADTALMLAKKHYAMSECFLEPNIYLQPGEHVLYKGLELIQRATPTYVRTCLDNFTRYILSWYIDKQTPPPYTDILEKVKQYKADFLKQKPDDIAKGYVISDYEKFVADDKNNLALNQHIPIHVKAAAIYNYLLNQDSNMKYRVKYNKIQTRDKVKFYYTTDKEYPCFGFIPDKFPIEFALPMDYNLQFEKTILEPINRILTVLGYTPLSTDLCFTTSLF